MLRITELRLPLDHPEAALRAAIVARLRIADADLLAFTVFKRGYDARKKTAIVLSYTVDCSLVDEASVRARLARDTPNDTHIRPSPDTRYQFVGHAPADFYSAGGPLRPQGQLSMSLENPYRAAGAFSGKAYIRREAGA